MSRTAHTCDAEPRFLLVHLDGLSYGELTRAIADGLAPSLGRFLGSGAELLETYSPVPSNTLNFFFRLLVDPAGAVVGNRWWRREAGCAVDVRRPWSLHEMEARFRGTRHGSLDDALLYGTLLGSKSDSAGMVISNIGLSNVLRTLGMLSVGFVSAFISSPTDWSLADVFRRTDAMGAARIAAAMRTGTHDLVYVCLSHYDQTAHKRGLRSGVSETALRACDGSVGVLLDHAGRCGYTPFIFSDHGLVPSTPFHETTGEGLAAVLRRLLPKRACRIFCSGNLAHLYVRHRNRDAAAVSDCAKRLSEMEAIGLVIDRANIDRPVFLTAGKEIGADLVHSDDARLGASLRRLAEHPDSGDMVLFGATIEGTAVNFMHQRACHNGWSLGQTQSFLAGNIAARGDGERDIVRLLLRLTGREDASAAY